MIISYFEQGEMKTRKYCKLDRSKLGYIFLGLAFTSARLSHRRGLRTAGAAQRLCRRFRCPTGMVTRCSFAFASAKVWGLVGYAPLESDPAFASMGS